MRRSMMSMGAIRVASLMCVVVACGCAQQRTPQAVYECMHVGGTPIVIDGKVDQAEWAQATALSFVIAGTEIPTTNRIEGRVMWDDAYLYVGIRACDEDVWSVFTERDATTYQEDVLEAFFVPSVNDPTYYYFEAGATGVMRDAMAVGYFSGGMYLHRWCVWNCDGLKVAVSVEGTLNDYTDRDRGRSVEMAIPFASLPSLKGKIPSAGDRWKFNLAGYDYSVYLKGEMQRFSCSYLTVDDLHRKADFMTMVFVRADQKQ